MVHALVVVGTGASPWALIPYFSLEVSFVKVGSSVFALSSRGESGRGERILLHDFVWEIMPVTVKRRPQSMQSLIES